MDAVPESVRQLLPLDLCDYTDAKFSVVESDFVPAFTLTMSTTAVTSEKEIKDWLQQFCTLSSENFVFVKSVRPKKPRAFVYKIRYGCHLRDSHKQCIRATNGKCSHKCNNCAATVAFELRNGESLVCIIAMNHVHNHSVSSADALKRLPVNEATKERLVYLFNKGYGAASALHAFRYELRLLHGENYYAVAANRSLCPDLAYVERLYAKTVVQNWGALDGPAAVQALREEVEAYNKAFASAGGAAAFVQKGHDIFVALCSPLMARIHAQIQHSSEICFVDSSGNYDRLGLRLFYFLTHSVAGGLPLAVGFCTTETENGLTVLYELIKSVVPTAGAFFGRGAEVGPLIFMTDDQQSERSALHNTWSEAMLLLCSFHTLQASWRWLTDGKNRVAMADRKTLFFLFKRLIYAQTPDEAERNLSLLMNNEVARHYPKFLERATEAWDRKEQAIIGFRVGLPTRGSDTNNYVEAAIKVSKESIFERTRALNYRQMFDYIATKAEVHYEDRLLDAAFLRSESLSKFLLPSNTKINLELISAISDSEFRVPSETSPNEYYTVDTAASFCTCLHGNTGRLCKHQSAVILKYSFQPTINAISSSSPLRYLLYRVATGQEAPSGYLDPIGAKPAESLPDEPTTSATDSLASQSSSNSPDDITTHDCGSFGSSNIDLQALESKFSVITDYCMQRLQSDPDIFASAISSFVSNFDKLSSDNSLVSALHTFGKYGNACGKKKIPVNVTGRMRRKHYHRGNVQALAGRPRLDREEPLTDYSDEPLLPSKKQKSAKPPHSISKCIAGGITVPRKH